MAATKFPKDDRGRSLPRSEIKNQEAEFVYWFYTEYLGETPDATSYQYGTALLRDLMSPGTSKFRQAQAYSAQDLARLCWYLRDKEVSVGGLEIFKTYDLLRSFVSGNERRLERLVGFFKRTQKENSPQSFVIPDGW